MTTDALHHTGLPRRGTIQRATLSANLLAVAVAVLVFRLPGSVVLSGVFSILAILIGGIRRPPRISSWWWGFLITACGCTMVGVLLDAGGLAVVNFFTLAVTFTLFSVAMLCSANPRTTASQVMRALYLAFGAALAVGLMEMVTGFKLQTILYPNASNLVFANRFMVAAWFPNYNDFGVVITMFGLMALTRSLLAANPSWLGRTWNLACFSLCFVVILIGGSRGALLALLLGAALILIMVVRFVRPEALHPLVIIVGFGLACIAALLLWSSPWVQDNSTAIRRTIIKNTLELAPLDSSRFWFGWGDLHRFMNITKHQFPGELMDPHNILLEVFIWFGMPALIMLAACWAVVSWQGLWRMEIPASWKAVSALVLFALTPVLGIVPSSSLRYYFLFILAPCAIVALRSQTRIFQRTPSAKRPVQHPLQLRG